MQFDRCLYSVSVEPRARFHIEKQACSVEACSNSNVLAICTNQTFLGGELIRNISYQVEERKCMFGISLDVLNTRVQAFGIASFLLRLSSELAISNQQKKMIPFRS